MDNKTTTALQAKALSPISRQVERASVLLDDLWSALDNHEQLLRPVLNSTPQNETPPSPVEEGSQLHNALNVKNDSLERAVAFVRKLSSELEL